MKDSFLFKITLLLLFVILFITGLYFARNFVIPVVFAGLLSMLLLPLCRRFEKWGLDRIPSIILCLLCILLVIAAILVLFYSQVVSFTNDLEMVEKKLTEKLEHVEKLIHEKTGVSSAEQMQWLKERYSSFMETGAGTIIKSFVLGFTNGIVALGLVLIYIFFFLLYRERFKAFILKLFDQGHHDKVEAVSNRTQDLILHYLTGLLIALFILGTMNTIGLVALGIPQGIFLGYLSGFLNIIPYVGALVGSMLPIMMALLFKDSMWYAVGVLAIFLFNQFIDNNITTPKVVGSHVQVNPLATIMAVITGGLVWGIPGMILFIPLIGVFKIVCDNVEPLQPLGYLLGEDEKEVKRPKSFIVISGIFKKKKKE